MKILFVGGGFQIFHLLENLQKKDVEIFYLTRKENGKVWKNAENLVKKHNFDAIFLFDCVYPKKEDWSFCPKNESDLLKYLKKYVQEVENFWKAAQKTNFKKLLYISSSATKNKKLQTYPFLKKVLEKIFMNDERNTILRIFNIFGEGQTLKNNRNGNFIVNLMQKISENKNLELFMNPELGRDWLDNKTIAKIYESLILKSVTEQILEIGSGKLLRNKDLINLCEKFFGKKINVNWESGTHFSPTANVNALAKYFPKIKNYDNEKEILEFLKRNYEK